MMGYKLWRKPVQTLLGILLIAAAVASFVICVGHADMTQKVQAELEYRFTTIALPTSNYNYKRFKSGGQGRISKMNDEVAAWVEKVIAEHPELAEGVSNAGFISAYIQDLQADHYVNHSKQPYYGVQYFSSWNSDNIPLMLPGNEYTMYLSNYDTAMLVVKLTEIGEVSEVTKPMTLDKTDPITGEKIRVNPVETRELILRGIIEEVVSITQQRNDPTGWPIELKLVLPADQDVQSLNLTVGQRYMVYGLDYYDASHYIEEYVEICASLQGRPHYYKDDIPSEEWSCEIGEFDFSKIHILTDSQIARWYELYLGSNVKCIDLAVVYGDTGFLEEKVPDPYRYDKGTVLLMTQAVTDYLTAKMTVFDFAALPVFSYEDGSCVLTRSIVSDGETKEISLDEYLRRYSIPTIQPINGSVSDFLAENSAWKNTLENSRINNQAFPVVGVQKLEYIADFNRGLSRVVSGRGFTKEELESGAKVCLISETLAAMNGLKTGDTIQPQFYDAGDNVPYESYIHSGKGVALPKAYYYTSQAELAEPESYTIVGIYRQSEAWGDVFANCYSFTSNTIFVPYNSVSMPMDSSSQGFFNTIVLKNGASQQFDKLVLSKRFATMLPKPDQTEMFVYYDQGYSLVRESLHDYLELTKQVLIVGVTVYGIILLLYLLLFPGRQGKVLRTMATMGTHRHKKIGYMLQNSLGILLPGSALGLAAAIVLWESVMDRLLSRSDGSFTLELDVLSLCAITLAQFAAAMLLVALLAIPMTRQKNLMKR